MCVCVRACVSQCVWVRERVCVFGVGGVFQMCLVHLYQAMERKDKLIQRLQGKLVQEQEKIKDAKRKASTARKDTQDTKKLKNAESRITKLKAANQVLTKAVASQKEASELQQRLGAAADQPSASTSPQVTINPLLGQFMGLIADGNGRSDVDLEREHARQERNLIHERNLADLRLQIQRKNQQSAITPGYQTFSDGPGPQFAYQQIQFAPPRQAQFAVPIGQVQLASPRDQNQFAPLTGPVYSAPVAGGTTAPVQLSLEQFQQFQLFQQMQTAAEEQPQRQ